MPLDLIGMLTRFEVEGEKKLSAALKDIEAQEKKVTAASNQMTAANQKAAAQQTKTAASIKATAVTMASFAIRAVAMLGITQKITRAAQDQVQAIFAETQEYKALEESIDRVQRAFVAAILPFDETLKLMERGAFLANKMADNLLTLSAIVAGISAVPAPDWLTGVERFGFQIGQLAGGAGQAEFSAAFNARMQEQGRAMAKTADEADKYERALEKLYQLTVRYDQELERNARALEKVNQAFGQAQVAAQGQLFSRMHQIELDYQKDVLKVNQAFAQARVAAEGQLSSRLQQIQTNYQNTVAKIEANALKSRLRAFADFERRISELQQRGVDNRAQQEQQQMLEREFATRRFQLSQIQSERIYQADRSWLVGEGDVLAIERLDERHGLEQQAQEENFRLQQQQAEAMFQLQLRFQEQALAQQINALQEALQLQLASIEENRQERIQAEQEQAEQERQAAKQAYAERLALAKAAQIEQLAIAKQGRAEEIAEAKQAYADQLATAKAAQIEQTNTLKEQLKEREKAMADSLAEFIRRNNLAAPQVMAAWRAVFGPNGEFDRLITQAVASANQRLLQLQAAMQAIAAAARGAYLPSTTRPGQWPGGSPGGGTRTPYPTPYPIPAFLRAHGGDDIVTSPTLFVAGEAGPERIITQPLSSVGGNISVSWRGSPIPVHGQGLEGADVSGLGNQIVEGLMIRMSNVIQNAREVR